MEDTLEIIKQADQLRENEFKFSKAIKILNLQADIIKNDPLLSYDYPLVLKKLGILYFDIGENEKAKEHLEQALLEAKTDLSKIEMADIRLVLTQVELRAGSMEKAMKYFSKAWEYIGTKRGEKFAQLKTDATIIQGNVRFGKGEYKAALKKYLWTLDYAIENKYTKGILTLIPDLAYHYIVHEEFDEAQEYLEKYFNVAKEFSNLLLLNFQMVFAELYLKKGQRDEAKRMASDAYRAISESKLLRLKPEASHLLGRVYAPSAQARADKHFKEAFDLYREKGYNAPVQHPIVKDWFTNFEDM